MAGRTTDTPRIIDLGINQIPACYTLTFSGYIADEGAENSEDVLISDDGDDAQIVTILIN